MADVLHHRLGLHFEVPFEVGLLGLFEGECQGERQKRVSDEALVILPVLPQVGEEIVPKSQMLTTSFLFPKEYDQILTNT